MTAPTPAKADHVGREAPPPNLQVFDGGVEWPPLALPAAVAIPEITADLMPSYAGAMARAVARSTQTPEAAAVMLGYAVVAAAVQRRFEIAPWNDDYIEPLSLWVLVAMESGSRKTGVTTAMQAPIGHWEKLMRDRMRPEIAATEAARLTAKKRIERLQQEAGKADGPDRAKLEQQLAETILEMPAEKRAPRLLTGDVTPERLQQLLAEYSERMTVFTDEAGMFAILAGAYSGGTMHLDVFLQAWSGASVKVDRGARQAHLDRPALSFGLAVQPGVLAEAADQRRFRESGLLARFLYALPRTTVGYRDVWQRHPVPDHTAAQWRTGLLALLEGAEQPATQPRVLPFSPEALEVWLAFADRCEMGMRPGGRFDGMTDWAAKLPGQAARIAGLNELVLTGPQATAVSTTSVQLAVRLCDLLIDHARATFRLIGANDDEHDAMHLLRWVQAQQEKQFDRRVAHKALEGRFRNVDRLKGACETLRKWNVLSKERLRKHPAARPTPYYLVNPQLFVDQSCFSP